MIGIDQDLSNTQSTQGQVDLEEIYEKQFTIDNEIKIDMQNKKKMSVIASVMQRDTGADLHMQICGHCVYGMSRNYI